VEDRNQQGKKPGMGHGKQKKEVRRSRDLFQSPSGKQPNQGNCEQGYCGHYNEDQSDGSNEPDVREPAPSGVGYGHEQKDHDTKSQDHGIRGRVQTQFKLSLSPEKPFPIPIQPVKF